MENTLPNDANGGEHDVASAEERERRMRESADSRWLSEAMKRSLLLEYEDKYPISPTLAARKLADIAEELGGDVLSLSAGGQIHHSPAEFVIEAAVQALRDGLVQFPGVRGFKDFRAAVARKLRRDNGIEADPDTQIIPTVGAQLCIDGVIRILVDPGDEVLLVDPEYASIEPIIRMCGGTVVHVPLKEGDREWHFDVSELERRITPRTKLFIFSNGNNPTGYLYTREDLEAILGIATRHDFFVFSDEQYEKIVFDGAKHCSIGSLPGALDRCILAYSFSKAYTMSGFRIGYMVGPAAIIDHMYNIVRFAVQSAPSISMKAAVAALDGPIGPYMEATIRELQEKRDYGVRRLNEMPGIRCTVPKGCYFLFPNVSGLGVDSFTLAEFLLREARVSVAPGIDFGPSGEGHIRISACVGMASLKEGLDRIERALPKLTSRRSGGASSC